jgi:hypothetical protein
MKVLVALDALFGGRNSCAEIQGMDGEDVVVVCEVQLEMQVCEILVTFKCG